MKPIPTLRGSQHWTAAFALPWIFLGPGVLAQGVTPYSPSQRDLPNAYRQMDAEETESRLIPTSSSYAPPESFLHWGPITARPHLIERLSYDTNLRSRAGANVDTVVEEIMPGSLFELGSKWKLDYTPTLSFYSSKQLQNTLNHSVLLSGATTYDNWAFTLSQSYLSISEPLIETGAQTDQEMFVTLFTASYHFNGKLLLEMGLNQSFRSAPSFSDSKSWSTTDWLNYQIAPRLSVAAGVGGGYDNIDASPDMAFAQVQGRVNARIANKLNLSVNAGVEIRQILGVGADPLLNPIYGASIQYRPFNTTTLTLSGARIVTASLLAGQGVESTEISLALKQRLLGRLYLTVGGGYRNSGYLLSNSALARAREDDTATFTSRLSYVFLKRGTIALFYNYSDSKSDAAGFGYASSQMGLEVAYRF